MLACPASGAGSGLLEGASDAARTGRELIAQDLAKIKPTNPEAAFNPTYLRAAEIFEHISTAEEFIEFLTLPLYEEAE